MIEAQSIADLWRGSARRFKERERRELVARWYSFHADMSELHARLSEEHQRKAERLCQDPAHDAPARVKDQDATPT